MEVKKSKAFSKAYGKLSERHKDAADEALRAFMENPNAPKLRNHALK